MPSFRLSDRDRERLGCPEFLPIDLSSVTNREAIVLARSGFATPRILASALLPKSDDGEMLINWAAWTGLVWLALRRAGVETDPQTLEFDIEDFEYKKDPEPEPAVEPEVVPGKSEDSTSSETTS